MSLVTLLIIILIVALFAGGPYTGWHNWGWYPSGAVLLLVVILLVLLLSGRL